MSLLTPVWLSFAFAITLSSFANGRSLKKSHDVKLLNSINALEDTKDSATGLIVGFPSKFKCPHVDLPRDGQLLCGDTMCFVHCDKGFRLHDKAAYAYKCDGMNWQTIPSDAIKTFAPRYFDICVRK